MFEPSNEDFIDRRLILNAYPEFQGFDINLSVVQYYPAKEAMKDRIRRWLVIEVGELSEEAIAKYLYRAHKKLDQIWSQEKIEKICFRDPPLIFDITLNSEGSGDVELRQP